MRENLSIERLRRLSEATPAQLAAIDLILGLETVETGKGESGNGEERPEQTGERLCAFSEGIDAEALGTLCSLLAKGNAAQQCGGTRAERILVRGRLQYLPGLWEVWVGGRHYDLRERTQARLCLKYLVEQKAFDPESARDLVEEIDPYVRERGNFPRAADIRIDDYFRDGAGRLRGLRRALIVSAGRHGRYFLRVD